MTYGRWATGLFVGIAVTFLAQVLLAPRAALVVVIGNLGYQVWALFRFADYHRNKGGDKGA